LAIVYYVLKRVFLGNITATVILAAAYFAILFALIHIAVFRARRYRLSRTRWRGIRAGQTGSVWTYLILSLIYTVITIVTLGLASPWMIVGLERYKMNNTWFGNGQFRLEASGARLFLRWIVALVLYFAPIIIPLALNWSWIIAASHATAGTDVGMPPHPYTFLLLFVAFFAGFPTLLWYRVATFRYLAGSVRLGDMRLTSKARTLPIIGYLLVYAGGLILLAIVFSVVASVLGAAALLPVLGNAKDPMAVMQAAGLFYLILVPIGILVFLPLAQILNYCWLQASLVRHFTTTLSAENIAELERVAQSTRQDSRFGEGLADAFDVDVGVV